MPTESEFLGWVYAQQRERSCVRVGPGDDLAVLDWNARDLLLVGIDQVLDGVHFDSTMHAPGLIGRKAMNRNLSDCAAMACLPVAAVAGVALPRGTSMQFAQELYQGMREAAEAFDCAIVGGDTGAWAGKLALTVAIVGRSDGIEPVTRDGARAGDGIFVTGALGGSILGRHLDFVPRIRLARELAGGGAISSMIDITDGLSRDLHSICLASRTSALIDAAKIPIHPDAIKLAHYDADSALDHALNDGEDHELLFTTSQPLDRADCVRIGKIVEAAPDEADRVMIESGGGRRPLPPRGWQATW